MLERLMASPSILIGFKPDFVSCTFTEEYGPIAIHADNTETFTSGREGVTIMKVVNDKPNIRSMSLIHVDALSAKCNSDESSACGDSILDIEPYEIRIFRSHENDSVGCTRSGANEQQRKILDEVSQMDGLCERLLDASMATKVKEGGTENKQKEDNSKRSVSDTQNDTNDIQGEQEESTECEGGGEISNFLLRCDAIVHEFLSAMQQNKHKINRNRSRMNSKGRSGNKRKRDNATTTDTDDSHDVDATYLNFSLTYFDALNKQCLQLDEMLDAQPRSTCITLDDNENGGKDHNIELNDDLTQLTINYYDQGNRFHNLVGELPLSFPSHGPSWVSDLPVPFEPTWKLHSLSNASTGVMNTHLGLTAAATEFINTISSCQTLWNDLDAIDSDAWVLEPSLPARRSCMERRLALTSALSVHFELDPDHPRSVPLTMRFIGPSKDISGLRDIYQCYISRDECAEVNMDIATTDLGTHGKKDEIFWSENLSLKENLERCFGFPLPSPLTTEKKDYLVECGVCYTHRISAVDKETTTIPDIACNNVKCGRSYHESCLSEWLHSIPGAKTSFGRIFGQCPYCCESISVEITGSM